ncbi:hypothetical protein AVEN_201588-1 [Araneus ventricosus]|uniref:Uncharacterized protein n=1 Tax=Araneus ventricosus TaxID=182803 RepID=A0A4Y2FGG7_ARAVE|nr:hypothetical protein AVEN_201588-1 [Araneus ventricosus]
MKATATCSQSHHLLRETYERHLDMREDLFIRRRCQKNLKPRKEKIDKKRRFQKQQRVSGDMKCNNISVGRKTPLRDESTPMPVDRGALGGIRNSMVRKSPPLGNLDPDAGSYHRTAF